MNQLLRSVRSMAVSCAVCMFVVSVTANAGRSDDGVASPFSGESLDGWTTQAGEPVTQGWEVVDGVLHLNNKDKRGGNIVTATEYGDFDLSFQFRIATGGNSGLKYRVKDFDGRTLGCEYQILDDLSLSHERPTKGTTGSLYDVYEPSGSELLMKPEGEYNTARIVVQGYHIQHWLNGQLIVSAIVGGPEWQRRIADSKFSDVRGFGRNRFGKIMLTDHGSEVWYKDFRMQTIDSSYATFVRGRAGGRNRRVLRNDGSPFRLSARCRRGWFGRR